MERERKQSGEDDGREVKHNVKLMDSIHHQVIERERRKKKGKCIYCSKLIGNE